MRRPNPLEPWRAGSIPILYAPGSFVPWGSWEIADWRVHSSRGQLLEAAEHSEIVVSMRDAGTTGWRCLGSRPEQAQAVKKHQGSGLAA